MTNSLRKKGILLAVSGATLWGINGTFADVVFSRLAAPVEWVVGTRLLVAGLIILLYAKFKLKNPVGAIWQQPKDRWALIAFSLIGMVSCQYLFFLSIGANGAGLATILQFTSPIIIYMYLVMSTKQQCRKSMLIQMMLLKIFRIELVKSRIH